MRRLAGKPPSTVVGEQTLPGAAGGFDKASLNGEFSFCPRLLTIPESGWVELQIGTNDYCPAHAEALSPVYNVKVLSRAEHAKLIQDQMAALADKLENIAAREEQTKADNEALAKLSDKELTGEEATAKLAEQAKAEQANAEAVKKLGEQIKETAKEALRNKDIPKDVLQKLAKMGASMDKLADQAMPDAADAMAQAAGESKAEDRKKDLADAVKKQEEIIKEMRENGKQLDNAQKRIDVDSYINRLKLCATSQTEQVAQAKLASPRFGRP